MKPAKMQKLSLQSGVSGTIMLKDYKVSEERDGESKKKDPGGSSGGCPGGSAVRGSARG